MANLSKQHFIKPTAVQMAALPLMFQEKSLLVVAPTGSGKTLAYAVPLLTIIKVLGGI
jgi:superfamily II DNA/RNA helicase